MGRSWLLVIGYWLLVIGYWLLVIGYYNKSLEIEKILIVSLLYIHLVQSHSLLSIVNAK